MMFSKKGLGDRLKAARNGMSQKEAASIIGQSQQAWGRWESGAVSPGAEILHQICSSFSVSADWLLGLPERGESITTGGDCAKCKLMQAHIKEITGR